MMEAKKIYLMDTTNFICDRKLSASNKRLYWNITKQDDNKQVVFNVNLAVWEVNFLTNNFAILTIRDDELNRKSLDTLHNYQGDEIVEISIDDLKLLF